MTCRTAEEAEVRSSSHLLAVPYRSPFMQTGSALFGEIELRQLCGWLHAVPQAETVLQVPCMMPNLVVCVSYAMKIVMLRCDMTVRWVL